MNRPVFIAIAAIISATAANGFAVEDARLNTPRAYIEQAAKLPPREAVELCESGVAGHPADKTLQAALVDAYLKLGRSELRNGSLPDARMAYAKAMAFAPDSAEADDGHSSAQRLERRAAAQVEGLRHELAKHRENDYARLQLGIALERLGKPDDALVEYRKIIRGRVKFDGGVEKIAQLRGYIEKSIVMLPPEQDTPPRKPGKIGPRETLETPHFKIIHHDRKLAEAAAKAAEQSYAATLKALGRTHPACRRASLYLVPTNAEFARITGNDGSTGHATVGGEIYVLATGPDAIRSTVRHEVAHLAAFRTVGKLPPWADEGLAVRREPDCWLHFVPMRGIVARREFIPIKQLLAVPSTRQIKGKAAINLFYQQAFTFADFLIEKHGGVRRLVKFAIAAEKGDADAAAARVYNVAGIKELELEWIDFVTQ